MLFALKKFISAFLFPLPFSTLLLFVAFILWRIGKKRFAGYLSGMAMTIILVASLPIVSLMMVNHLELQYPKYADQKVDFVVVLGNYHMSSEHVPLSSLLSKTSLMRLTEGIMIYRANPGAKLLLSGYGGRDEISNAKAMSFIAIEMGVPESDIMIEERARDTGEEARFQSKVVGQQPFALVTSASHIPRAMYLFERYGTNPIAAPTNYSYGGLYSASIRNFIPSSGALSLFDMAWHEYMGLVWSYIRY